MIPPGARPGRRRAAASLAALIGAALLVALNTAFPNLAPDLRPAIVETTRVPQAALDVAIYADAHGGAAQPGFAGNRPFYDNGNGADLPDRDSSGRRIRYREYDVHPLRDGVPRGSERVVLGSDGSAYYTSDHYKHFKKFR